MNTFYKPYGIPNLIQGLTYYMINLRLHLHKSMNNIYLEKLMT